MTGKTCLHTFQIGTYAIQTLLPQATAILVLPPTGYGQFSLMYLFYGLGTSVIMTCVCEPWVREGRDRGSRGAWAEYAGTNLVISVVVGLLSGLFLTLFLQPSLLLLLPPLAVAAGTFRVGARYYQVSIEKFKWVLVPELLGILIFIGTLVCGKAASLAETSEGHLSLVVLAWTLSNLVAAICQPWMLRGTWRSFCNWWKPKWGSMKYLVADSALLEAGSSGVQLVFAPILGAHSFGMYRALTSTAVPVRLLLNPIRPRLSTMPLSRLLKPRFLSLIVAMGLVLGSAVYCALYYFGKIAFFSESIIGQLGPVLGVQASVFVAFNFVSSVLYFAARTSLRGQWLINLRVLQFIGSLVGPIGGYFLGNISGAAWGAVCAMVFETFILVFCLRRVVPRSVV